MHLMKRSFDFYIAVNIISYFLFNRCEQITVSTSNTLANFGKIDIDTLFPPLMILFTYWGS